MADNKELKKDVETKEEKNVPIAEEKNEIKETTGSSVEIYDEDDDFDVEETKKPKKSRSMPSPGPPTLPRLSSRTSSSPSSIIRKTNNKNPPLG